MAKKGAGNSIHDLRREVKKLDKELMRRIQEFATARDLRDELYADLQERCPHGNTVHFQGTVDDDLDESQRLDFSPAERLCLDCGESEVGQIPDSEVVLVTQRIASSFIDSTNVIDAHSVFLVLREKPIHCISEGSADDFIGLSLAELERWKRKIKASRKK